MSLGSFVYSALPTRVVFGRGRIAEVGSEAARLGIRRPLVITTAQQAGSGQRLVAATGGVAFAGAAMHTPVEVTEDGELRLAGDGGTLWFWPAPVLVLVDLALLSGVAAAFRSRRRNFGRFLARTGGARVA